MMVYAPFLVYAKNTAKNCRCTQHINKSTRCTQNL